MKIVFLSHTPRNSIFKVGSYHLSNEFARMGHDVLYIPSALSPFHLANIPALIWDEDYRKVLKCRLQTLSPKQDDHNITNLTPFVLTPFNRGIFDNPRIPLKQQFTFNSTAKKIKERGFAEADMVIQDKVGLFFMRKFIRAKNWIYRATDDYSNMPGGPGKESIQTLEQHICDYADRVVVTSGPLRELFEERYGVEAEVIRNGVDVGHFTKKQKKPAEYVSLEDPIILYLGSLDDRFDLDLLMEVARKNQDYHHVIIGPGSKEAIPKSAANISALGPKPYAQVPAYMQHADVGILPLKLTEANHARSPMKMYEYGICGLPVVSTPLRELQSRNEEFVTFAETSDQFYDQITYCLEQRDQLSEAARRSSGKHSWKSIAKKMLTSNDE
jgi:glycosyltransferase involved in cell wall biosynthesis